MTFGKPFEPGREKTVGRKPGVRNKISQKFLGDLHAEWERSGPDTLKILAKENPEALAKLVAETLPKQFDDEMPPTVRIITGVPRHGEELPPGYFDRTPRSPQIPPAFPDQLPSPVKEGDDA